jgi:hypothetical protein
LAKGGAEWAVHRLTQTLLARQREVNPPSESKYRTGEETHIAPE